MFKDILQSRPDHPSYHCIAVSLLERMDFPKEEESVRESIRLIFQQIWFTPPPESTVAIMQKALESQRSPMMSHGVFALGNRKEHKIAASALHIEFTAHQLVAIAALGSSTRQSIEQLLRDLLHGSAEGSEVAQAVKLRRQSSQSYCEKIVQCLVEMLLSTEDMLAELYQDGVNEGNQEHKHEELATFKTNVIATVAMFCEVHPPLVSSHLLTFSPYLKRPSGNITTADIAIAQHVMKILEATATLQKNVIQSRSEEIIQDLSHIVLTQGGSAVNAAISCIASMIASVTHDALPLFRIAEKCFNAASMLAKSSIGTSVSAQQNAQLQRCMVVLGGLCAHYKKYAADLQQLGSQGRDSSKLVAELNEDAAHKPLAQFKFLEPHILTGSCYAVAAFAYQSQDDLVRARSVQAMCNVFSGNPRLMLVAQSTSLLQQMLDLSNSEVIHERLLEGLRTMLTIEESNIEKNLSFQLLKESGVDVSTRHTVLGPGDSDSDASIAGFVIQQHLSLITNFLSHSSSTLRLNTLQLLGSLLRQGMVCPLDALALLVMLQCDRDEVIRVEALQLLIIQDERHPTFLENRLREGVELAYDFQLSIYGNVQALFNTSSGDSMSYFGPVYTSCVQPNKKRAQGFLQSLSRKLSLLSHGCAVAPSASEITANQSRAFEPQMSALSQSQYLASVLASLPFSLVEEVLLLLHLINRSIPYEMGVLLAEMKETVKQYCAAVSPEDAKDMLPPPSSTGSSKLTKRRGKESSTAVESDIMWDPTLASKHIKAQSHSDLVSQSSQLVILIAQLRCKETLIRLKSYLKIVYKISDERSAAFDPNTKAVSSVQERISPVDSLISFLPLSSEALGTDQLIDQLTMHLATSKSAPDDSALLPGLQHTVDEYNRLSWLLKCDPDDFKISTNTKHAKKSPALTKTRSPKRKATNKAEDGDDDYTSDHSSSRGVASTPSRSSTKRAVTKRPISYLAADDFIDDEA
jgi:hypothetical protein